MGVHLVHSRRLKDDNDVCWPFCGAFNVGFQCDIVFGVGHSGHWRELLADKEKGITNGIVEWGFDCAIVGENVVTAGIEQLGCLCPARTKGANEIGGQDWQTQFSLQERSEDVVTESAARPGPVVECEWTAGKTGKCDGKAHCIFGGGSGKEQLQGVLLVAGVEFRRKAL